MWFPEINHILNSSHIIILLPESKDGIAFPCKQGYFWQLNCGLLANDYLMATWLLLFHLFCPVLQNILPPEFQTFQIWGWIKFLRQNNIRYQSPCIEEIKVTDLALHGSLCRRCILFLNPQKITLTVGTSLPLTYLWTRHWSLGDIFCCSVHTRLFSVTRRDVRQWVSQWG